MTLREIAEELVAGCREDRVEENLGKLYAVDAVSVEATPGPDGSRETRGLDGIRGKHQWWNSTFEVHDADVDGPFLHGDDRFAVVFEFEAENRETGERSEMEEVGVYHVRDGKIVREEFFYTT
jgi:ketosteroid isomerase-like protein